TDSTAELVREIADANARVRLLEGAPLPAGWCGKNWACAQLAQAATRPLLLFVDADVRLEPEAARTITAWMRAENAQLASGVPFQKLGSWSERLLVPLIHFVLLGFLPLRRMRQSTIPPTRPGSGN
ncbi:MAG: glycosyltransferase, partial [Acidobacteriota bacterium]|nr:glycosyltransferase [Acidobacteriota bacterium]